MHNQCKTSHALLADRFALAYPLSSPCYVTAAIADCIPASRPDRSAVASSRMERFPIGEKINWQIGEMVGAGAFGRVYLGLNNDTGQLMAVKQVQWHVC